MLFSTLFILSNRNGIVYLISIPGRLLLPESICWNMRLRRKSWCLPFTLTFLAWVTWYGRDEHGAGNLQIQPKQLDNKLMLVLSLDTGFKAKVSRSGPSLEAVIFLGEL